MTEIAKRCDQCGKSTGIVQEAWICDPGEQPIMAWLHRECEAAFLQRLDDRKKPRAAMRS
jgi:hypothetical protein